MIVPVFNSIAASIVNDIKATGSSYDSANFNYVSGGTAYDLDRDASSADLKLLRVKEGGANDKVKLTQDVFDKIKNGNVVNPQPSEPGSHFVFVIGSERFEVVQSGKDPGDWQTECALSAYSFDAQVLTDIKTGGAVYDAASQGYKIGATVYTLKRKSQTPNYKLNRQTGLGNTDRVFLTDEMFNIIKTSTTQVPPLPCNHPVFLYSGMSVSIAYFSAGAAPFQGAAIRHNGP